MRKNPHVRICGGLGSATTLVYPTPDLPGDEEDPSGEERYPGARSEEHEGWLLTPNGMVKCQEPAFSMSNIVLRPPTSSTTAAKRRTPVEDRSGLDVPAGLDDRSSPADRAPVRPTSHASMSG